MEFIEEIKVLENTFHHNEDFITMITNSKVLLTNIPHVDSTPLEELYIKAITRYVASNTLSSYIVNAHDKPLNENYHNILKRIINENNISLVINLCNTKSSTSDITYEQVQPKEFDYVLIKELEDAFHEVNITKDEKVVVESPILKDLNIDVIQVGINENARDIEGEKLKHICDALINYIKMFTNYSD